jgi:hypothetical protein
MSVSPNPPQKANVPTLNINSLVSDSLDRVQGTLRKYQGENGIGLFCREVLGVHLHPYQDEILRALVRERRVAVRGPHGIGKSFLSSCAVLWIVSTAPDTIDTKVVTTASAWRQLEKFLWPEINRLAMNADWGKIGLQMRRSYELMRLSIRLSGGREAFAVASDNPALIEGAHAKRIGYIFDESKSIRDGTWDAAEGAFSQEGLDGHEVYALAVSTPGDSQGRFYDIHQRKPGLEGWWTRHVTLEEAIEAGQISEKWARDRRNQWGSTSPMYKRRVLGEFATDSAQNVIPLEWVELAHERWQEWQDLQAENEALADDLLEESAPLEKSVNEVIGCDPSGETGRDDTVIIRLRDMTIVAIHEMNNMDPVEIGELLIDMASHNERIAIDSIGIGAGVVAHLRKKERSAHGVNVSEPTHWTDISGEIRFLNLRSFLWWLAREYLDPTAPHGKLLAFPEHDRLTQELTAPLWKQTTRGVVQVEAKALVKKRLSGRSTDLADALMLALYAQRVGSNHGIWL